MRYDVKILDSDGAEWVVDKIKYQNFVGTQAEWDALTAAEQAKYSVKMITDDETGATVDAVTDGDMRAVTSNAVYDAINDITIRHRYLDSGESVTIAAKTSAYTTTEEITLDDGEIPVGLLYYDALRGYSPNSIFCGASQMLFNGTTHKLQLRFEVYNATDSAITTTATGVVGTIKIM